MTPFYPFFILFGLIVPLDLVIIAVIAILCMIIISVWLIRNQYYFAYHLVSWLLLIAILFFGSWWILHEENHYWEDWKNLIRNIAQSFVFVTEAMGHAQITEKTPPDDPIYDNILQLHSRWCREIPVVAAVYTLRRQADDKHQAAWIVHCPTDINQDNVIYGPEEMGKKLYEPLFKWQEIYEKGFDGQIAWDENVRYDNKKFVTIILPLHHPDKPSEIEAILGVNFRCDQWQKESRRIHFSIFCFLILILTLYFSGLWLIVILQNMVAQLLRSNQELNETHKRVEIAVKSKNNFMLQMSREIRNPLNALIGFTEILTKRISSYTGNVAWEESEGILEIIRNSSSDILIIINAILDYSKIEANQLQLEMVPLSIREIIDEVFQQKKSEAHAKQLHFTVEYKKPIPEWILGDPTRLRQILRHLIDNAIKYTKMGKVVVTCSSRIQPHLDENKQTNKKDIEDSYLSQYFCPEASIIQIEVIDTGIGISPEEMKYLFQPFIRTDLSQNEDLLSRTGLGLSISKRLAQLMDGDLSVVSTPNVGSTFTLTLHVYLLSPQDTALILERKRLKEESFYQEPRIFGINKSFDKITVAEEPEVMIDKSIADKEVEKEVPKQPLLDVRILLVEDTLVNQLVFSTQLRNAGAQVEITNNGELGVKKIKEDMDNGLSFDVVLMDMQMPVMDGYEATSILRSQGYQQPIIAVTAHALLEDREKTIQAGCNDYLSKPVDQKILIDTIRKYLR